MVDTLTVFNTSSFGIYGWQITIYTLSSERMHRRLTKIGFSTSLCYREIGFDSREMQEDVQNWCVLLLDRA